MNPSFRPWFRGYLIFCFVMMFALLTAGLANAQGFAWPLANTGGRQWQSSPFGDRMSPMGGNGSGFHSGIDLAARKGTPVLAAADGVVVSCYPAPNGFYKGDKVYGGMVVIRVLSGGIYCLYGHLSKTLVEEGQAVRAGQTIGLVGSSGISTGPHLHFEILLDPTAAFDRTPSEWNLTH